MTWDLERHTPRAGRPLPSEEYLDPPVRRLLARDGCGRRRRLSPSTADSSAMGELLESHAITGSTIEDGSPRWRTTSGQRQDHDRSSLSRTLC